MSGKGDQKSKVGTNAKSAPRTGINSQPEKRSASDMENSSFSDEITMLNKQLEQLAEDTKVTRDKVNDMLPRMS